MQKYNNGQVLYSPSDLVTFLSCRHASFIDLKSLNGEVKKKFDVDATARLLQKKGIEHETYYLEQLHLEKKSICKVSKNTNLEERANITLKAMKSGVDVIYQAVLLSSPWRGDADFLIKSTRPSALGNFSYEVLDTKLARSPEPKHIIQLCVYSDMLAHVQLLRPLNIHLFLGDNKKYTFQLNDFYYYYNYTKKNFLYYIHNLPTKSYPEPCKQCNFCPWHNDCKNQWKQDSHLSLVANIQRSQIDKLKKFGIHKMRDLAESSSSTTVPNLSSNTFHRLRSQALLQQYKMDKGQDKFELIPVQIGKGFSRMPIPNNNDLFFDMEGDPLYPGGLEYLFGVYYNTDKKKEVFTPFWAHSHKAEEKAFKRFMSFLNNHLLKYPNAYIYHYNHYETTALKRLSCRYAVFEKELDDLLRHNKFIDLYLVVRESIRISEPGYSIKNLETFYMQKRKSAVATATDSIIVYNTWKETKARNLLKEIMDYNKIDCISTQLLRDWLLELKPSYINWYNNDITINISESKKRKDFEIEYEKYKNRLLTTKAPSILEIRNHILHILEFHNREVKPIWWSKFERQNKLEDELINDTECIGSLELVGAPEKSNRSLIYTYRYPNQEYKFKKGSVVSDVATMKDIGTISSIDVTTNRLRIKRAITQSALPEYLSIGPPRPIDSRKLRSAIYSYADSILNNLNSSYPITELLKRNPPQILDKKTQGPIIRSGNEIYTDILNTVINLKNSYLFIQGPPGCGKTFISSHIIIDLIKLGKKIGITSNSHKAIHNLLSKVEELAIKQKISFKGVKKSTANNIETIFNGKFIFSQNKIDHTLLNQDLFAGTAWTFSDIHFKGCLDYLFIDEAGQVSTANVVAMSRSTKNVILVGDQMQLGQPIQGTHPGESGSSVLEFLLKNHRTIPPEKGVFLNTTKRMRPSICQFISDAFYDQKLLSDCKTVNRNLRFKDFNIPNEGIVIISADHNDCTQKSCEEGEIIKKSYNYLVGQEFEDSNKAKRVITANDILVVTPYNVQVNYLKSILSKEARIGTVDNFQGQEAPVVLISMTTSCVEYLSQNMEFIYSKNRLNVAISRAQCLVIVIASPKLLQTSCNTINQMTLINTFCHLNYYSKCIDKSVLYKKM